MDNNQQLMVAKAKRELNYATVLYTVSNGDTHFIVAYTKGLIDFWPTTGKWKSRNSGEKGNTLHSLLTYILKTEHNIKQAQQEISKQNVTPTS